MRRSKLEMYICCLEAISKGKDNTTKIFNDVKINNKVLRKYLQLAAERGEITITPLGRSSSYCLNEKGLRLLEDWKTYKTFSEEMKKFLGEHYNKKK